MNVSDEFAEFEAAGEVEVGESNLASQENEPEAKPAKKSAAPKPDPVPADPEPDAQAEGDADENDSEEENTGEEDEKKPDPKESQINRLKREKRELAKALREAQNTDLMKRIDELENRLQGGKSSDTNDARAIPPAPDPTDAEKYPLGRLDDRYIEDRIEHGILVNSIKQADAVLQREQENERNQSIQQEQVALLGKVDEISSKGSELYDDFQESVVETGMRGDWDLSQTTFEAAAEADNGAQILYELSQDTKEASRVAKLSPLAQLKYVNDRDAEIGKVKTPRTKPAAGAPPQNHARGANSRTHISPATDNLDDFEKAWELDAKKSR